MSVIRPIHYPADKLDRLIRDGIIPPPILDKNFAKLRNLGLHDAIPVAFSRASDDTSHWPDLRTQASNVAAFDHHPVSGQSYGLQVPAAATNECLQSEDFGTSWTVAGLTLTTNDAAAPDGASTADKLDDATATSAHRTFQSTSVASGATVTFSIFLKNGDRQYATVNINAGANNAGVTVDLAAGTITDSQSRGTATLASSSITDVGNGWYRVNITGDIPATLTYFYVISAADTGTGITDMAAYSYTGSNKTIYAWGAQVEEGATFPTPYIKTTTSASRAATSATIALSSVPGLDLTDFTVLMRGRTAAGIDGTQPLIQIDDGSALDRVGIWRLLADSKIAFFCANGGATQVNTTINAVVADNTDMTVAVWFKANSFYAALNVGGTITTASDLAGDMPTGMTTIRLGKTHTTEYFGGALSRNAMWNGGSEQFVRQLVT